MRDYLIGAVRYLIRKKPSTLADIFWLKRKGYAISIVEPRIETQVREAYIELAKLRYETDLLLADFHFEGWESPISITKPYGTDFNPPSYFGNSNNPEQIVRVANSRLKRDILRAKKHGIILQENLFTEEIITRERPASSGQRITSLADVIDEMEDAKEVAIEANKNISNVVGQNNIPKKVLSVVYCVIIDGQEFRILKDYMINSNGMYVSNEAVRAANLRMKRDIQRLHEAGLKISYIPFNEEDLK